MNNLVEFGKFLGKYKEEIEGSFSLNKYAHHNLQLLLPQKYGVNISNPVIIVDTHKPGLWITAIGQKFFISEDLYNSDLIDISDSTDTNFKKYYTPDVFSTLSYLMCRNLLSIRIKKSLNQPVYINVTSDYELLSGIPLSIELSSNVSVHVIEEISSKSFLIPSLRYTLGPRANLELSTFYKNNIASNSVLYRDITAQRETTVDHTIYCLPSSYILDETLVRAFTNAKVNIDACMSGKHTNTGLISKILPYNEPYDATVRSLDLSETPDAVCHTIIDDTGHTEIHLHSIHKDTTDAVNLCIQQIESKSILEISDDNYRFLENRKHFLNTIKQGH